MSNWGIWTGLYGHVCAFEVFKGGFARRYDSRSEEVRFSDIVDGLRNLWNRVRSFCRQRVHRAILEIGKHGSEIHISSPRVSPKVHQV